MPAIGFILLAKDLDEAIFLVDGADPMMSVCNMLIARPTIPINSRPMDRRLRDGPNSQRIRGGKPTAPAAKTGNNVMAATPLQSNLHFPFMGAIPHALADPDFEGA